MVTYVYRDGSRLTPWMLYQINRLSAECKRLFGCEIKVTSAIRTNQEQINIFLSRYVTAANIRGRRVYDTRVWNGVRYYRIDPNGTVAQPSTSNHEIQGSTAAVDIRDTGSDAGIMTKTSARGRWIRQVAAQYDMDPEGDGFGEGWHFRIRNIFNTPPGGSPASVTDQKDDGDMTQQIKVDGKHLFTIGKEFLSHNATVPQSEINRKIFSGEDELHNITWNQFMDLLDGQGIPRDVVEKSGKVKDPVTGKFAGNNVWSIGRANLAKK